MSIFYPVQWFANIVSYSWMGIGQGTYLGNAVKMKIFQRAVQKELKQY